MWLLDMGYTHYLSNVGTSVEIDNVEPTWNLAWNLPFLES